MKVKMVKMGVDIDENRNHRVRGIIPTDNNEYLFVEVNLRHRPEIQNTNLSRKDYENKYPNESYIGINECYRVDIPKDYRNCSSKGFHSQSFPEYEYTNENIVKVLQTFNKNIKSIELTNENYIEKYCEEKGFFELYDDRLKHKNEIQEINWIEPEINGKVKYKYKYTCYAVNGSEYSEIRDATCKMDEVINEYGKEKVKNLANKYMDTKIISLKSDIVIKRYEEIFKKAFEDNLINLESEFEEYSDI